MTALWANHIDVRPHNCGVANTTTTRLFFGLPMTDAKRTCINGTVVTWARRYETYKPLVCKLARAKFRTTQVSPTTELRARRRQKLKLRNENVHVTISEGSFG